MKIDIFGEELDKQGNLLTIKHTETLSYSPAFSFLLRRLAELIENNHGAPTRTWNDDECGIIWAENNGIICGIFAYSRENIHIYKKLSICLTAVDKEYRGRGIHAILNKYFEDIAKNLGCIKTEAKVNPKNTVRLETAKKDGLQIKYKEMYKQL